MYSFFLWAPRARAVSVQVAGSLLAMKQEAHGWWKVTSLEAAHGSDYAFLLDGDEVLYPDPRSLWQPNGIHRPSRVYDHSLFEWSDIDWRPPELSRAIIYELHVGTFSFEGTFDAAIQRLDYLVALGISHVELMPVASFPGSRGWGYDGVLLYSTYEGYGGPDGLKGFVDACHGRGLAVLLDVVYNHFGPTGNYTEKFGPYLTNSHWTPWGGAVNLEGAGSDQVRRFYCDNAISWMRDFHIDGLRLDAIHSLVDRSAVPFLEQLSVETARLSAAVNKRLVLIAESDLNDPRTVTDLSANGLGLDAQWSDDFHHALFTVLVREEQGYYEDYGSLARLCKALTSTFVYDGQYSTYRDRTHGRSARGVPQSRFLGYIQNHDQIGNRALGERLYPLISQQKAFIAAGIVLTSPFIPMLFQGEEFASSSPFQYFADHGDTLMAQAVSEGRRKEFAGFGWPLEQLPDPEALATFVNSKLDWTEVDIAPHYEFLQWYRALITLRTSEPSIHNSDLHKTECSFHEEEQWLIVDRGRVAVFCNLGTADAFFELRSPAIILLSSPGNVRYIDDILYLGPDTLAILKYPDA